MKKLLFLFLLILSKNILSINKELKQAIEELNLDKTKLLLEQTYKSFEAKDKEELTNLVKNIQSKIYGPFNITTTLVSGVFSYFGAQVLAKFAVKILKNGSEGRPVNFIPSYSIGYNEIDDFFNRRECCDYIDPLGGMPTNIVNIPMLGFSALSIYVFINRIVKTINSTKMCNLLNKYISTDLNKTSNS